VSYTNCTNCHVQRTDDDIPFFSVESHELDFRLGYNVLRGSDRPHMYTPVRHVPIDADGMSFYGVEFENFDAVPTWAYATPHNIQRITPQTESCLSCHENDDVFLTADAVAPEERGANAGVIVESAPPMPEGFENVITGQEDAAPVTDETDSGDDGGFWGDEPADDADDSSSDDAGFWGDEDDSSDETDEDTSDDDDFWNSN
jgi:hypothetical protein